MKNAEFLHSLGRIATVADRPNSRHSAFRIAAVGRCSFEELLAEIMSLSSLICFRPRTFFKVFAKTSTNPTHVERSCKHQQNRYRNHEVPQRGAYTAERTQSSCVISSHDYGEEQGNTDTDKFYRAKRASFCFLQSTATIFRIDPLQLGIQPLHCHVAPPPMS
jgi:hypothetical protein